MQDGWFVVSKILINKFDVYIVNFNKLTIIVLRKRDTLPGDDNLKIQRTKPKKTNIAVKKEALCPVNADRNHW